MDFDVFVAIDWSGARNVQDTIQIAQCETGNGLVKLVRPQPGGRWTRTRVVEWLRLLFRERIALVGFDFAFAYPFCDFQAYFPGNPNTPQDVWSLWSTVEGICTTVPDLYGGPFYKNQHAPFADYLLYQTYRGSNYQGRFRATEQAARNIGTTPANVFKCVGPSVGVGSIAGFRLLKVLSDDPTTCLWPFQSLGGLQRSVVVEIFPQVFLRQAAAAGGGLTNFQRTQQALACFGGALEGHAGQLDFSEDQRDALVSAAALRRLSSDPWIWRPPSMNSCHASHEGWIFGV